MVPSRRLLTLSPRRCELRGDTAVMDESRERREGPAADGGSVKCLFSILRTTLFRCSPSIDNRPALLWYRSILTARPPVCPTCPRRDFSSALWSVPSFASPVQVTVAKRIASGYPTWSYRMDETDSSPYPPSFGHQPGVLHRDWVTVSEDSHTVNIFAPEGTKPSDSLPVLVWIYGGSLNNGSAHKFFYDPTEWIRASPDQPFIMVTGNYRTNIFGASRSTLPVALAKADRFSSQASSLDPTCSRRMMLDCAETTGCTIVSQCSNG
jgi:hypothetical protein